MRQLQGVPTEWLKEAHLSRQQEQELLEKERRELQVRLSREEIYAQEEPDFDTWQVEK